MKILLPYEVQANLYKDLNADRGKIHYDYNDRDTNGDAVLVIEDQNKNCVELTENSCAVGYYEEENLNVVSFGGDFSAIIAAITSEPSVSWESASEINQNICYSLYVHGWEYDHKIVTDNEINPSGRIFYGDSILRYVKNEVSKISFIKNDDHLVLRGTHLKHVEVHNYKIRITARLRNGKVYQDDTLHGNFTELKEILETGPGGPSTLTMETARLVDALCNLVW